MGNASKEIQELFRAFEQAPLEDFIEHLFSGLTKEQMNRFVIDDVSYHRDNPRYVSLSAWLTMKPVLFGPRNNWISIDYLYDSQEKTVDIRYCVRDFVQMESLSKCFDYYSNQRESDCPDFSLEAIFESDSFKESDAKIPIAVGYSSLNEPFVIDLAKTPHLLIAGTSEQGQTQVIQALALSIMKRIHTRKIKLCYIDTKAAGSNYNQGKQIFGWLSAEMEERLENQTKEYPDIVVIAKDICDLTYPIGNKEAIQTARDNYSSIIRLLQKGHLVGIHMVLVTLRPSKDVITGLIKSNIPSRIAFRVCTKTDSLTVLDMPGAEDLIGNGDMILSFGGKTEKIQAPTANRVEIEEFEKVVSMI